MSIRIAAHVKAFQEGIAYSKESYSTPIQIPSNRVAVMATGLGSAFYVRTGLSEVSGVPQTPRAPDSSQPSITGRHNERFAISTQHRLAVGIQDDPTSTNGAAR